MSIPISHKHKYFAVTNISAKKSGHLHKDVTALAEVLRSLIVNFSSSTHPSKKVARRSGESESPESEYQTHFPLDRRFRALKCHNRLISSQSGKSIWHSINAGEPRAVFESAPANADRHQSQLF
jgi:hypothetical protein